MSTLYPRLPAHAAKERYKEVRQAAATSLVGKFDTIHPAQYFAPTGGGRATPDRLTGLRVQVVELAEKHGFPERSMGRSVQAFDIALARTLHTDMDLVPAEAAVRPMWAFLALVLLPDIAVWRYPQPPEDRVLATDITRHVFGRLWWRAEMLRDAGRTDDPYALLDVFPERNFDQILARRRSIGGSPDLVRALAKEWPKDWSGRDETSSLQDVLKLLMRRGAVQDLFGMPENLLRLEVARTISEVRHGRQRSTTNSSTEKSVGRHARQ